MDLSTVTYYFTRYGAIAIFVIVFLEYLNLPGFPAGIIMPLSGIMAARGNIHFFWVMVITVAAGLLGSLMLYALGWKGGEVFLNAYTRRFPKQKEALEKNLDWIRRKGCMGVFLGKLLPMIRTLVSIPAGVVKMNLGKYVISSTCGIFLWNFVFVGAGYVLGDQVFQLLGSV
ncbi:MAG: DedA family protein [Roseburia sp.]|nr:DedA family protein [Roseburia sp.]MCM1098858.1 DedA family protein [Ruminococcus flavefaciens]